MLPTRLPEATAAIDRGITRRQFFTHSIAASVIVAVGALGSTTLAFLWPALTRGSFGTKIRAGRADELLERVRAQRAPVYLPEGRVYVTAFPAAALPQARREFQGDVLAGMEAGIVALYQKCVHLGCRVPWCTSSQWFECPCHGSKFSRVGEQRDGPAPRGLDRFAVTVDDGVVSIDTAKLFLGPPIGTDTTGQQPEGPHCVTS